MQSEKEIQRLTMDINTTTPASSGAAQTVEEAPRRRGVFTLMVWLGAVLALAAWVVLFWDGRMSFYVALAALICSCVGLKSDRKNLAITAIVASSVLMFVFAVFEGAIYYLLRTTA